CSHWHSYHSTTWFILLWLTKKYRNNMFRLYKQRNFSELINDTFAFFRTYGKSYFKGYFIINGGLLLTLLVLMYLMGSFFVDTLSTGISNPSGGESIITENIQSNFGMFMLAGLAGFVLILI